jgi:Signal peptidase, peptidase S26
VADEAPPVNEATESDTTPKKKQRPFWRELPILIVVALLLSFLLQTFIARVYLIPSESMEPTLHGCAGCTGDRIVVEKLSYAFGEPRRCRRLPRTGLVERQLPVDSIRQCRHSHDAERRIRVRSGAAG